MHPAHLLSAWHALILVTASGSRAITCTHVSVKLAAGWKLWLQTGASAQAIVKLIQANAREDQGNVPGTRSAATAMVVKAQVHPCYSYHPATVADQGVVQFQFDSPYSSLQHRCGPDSAQHPVCVSRRLSNSVVCHLPDLCSHCSALLMCSEAADPGRSRTFSASKETCS